MELQKKKKKCNQPMAGSCKIPGHLFLSLHHGLLGWCLPFSGLVTERLSYISLPFHVSMLITLIPHFWWIFVLYLWFT
jgi:hypothetical protein